MPPQDFLASAPGRLGLLGSDVALRVLVAHAEADRFRNVFRSVLAHGIDRPVPGDERDALSEPYTLLVRKCERAIRALEDITGRAFPPAHLPTNKAESARDAVEPPEAPAK